MVALWKRGDYPAESTYLQMKRGRTGNSFLRYCKYFLVLYFIFSF